MDDAHGLDTRTN